MASIKISELRSAGSELFQDSESFLNELNEQATSNIFGGGGGVVISQNTVSVGISILTESLVTYNYPPRKKHHP